MIRKSGFLVGAALVLLVGALLVADRVPAGRANRAGRAGVDGEQLLLSVMSHVRHSYIDSTYGGRTYDLATQGVVRRLGDAHAAYISADRLSLFRERASGPEAGPGLDLDERNGFIVVIAAYSGSPAARAGIRSGDRVIAVNGERTFGMSAEEVRLVVDGRAGSRVDLLLERPGVAEDRALSLVRELAPERSVRAALSLTEEVAYVRVDRFSRTTAPELDAAIEGLNGRAISALVVDLRGNPGGPPEAGVAVADLFLPSGVALASTRGRPGTVEQAYHDSTPSRWGHIELILLVNEGTANASEVAAGALQDLDRALVVGHNTFGRGSRQDLVSLTDGGALLLTTSRWYTPLGRRLEPETALGRPRSSTANPDAGRPRLLTASGRTVLGGGGIRPDVIVRAQAGEGAESDQPPDVYDNGSARRLLERDPFVRLAVDLANRSTGQSELFVRAQALARLDPEERGGQQ
jgi:carboxyl-terminal processing protease